ncbi:hypothetical protein I4F81_009958 [Pyropia yezoensis]|uniref:Uncharacterized protein n=1 Tax=Pyropia yezoensis TaxID=2788 RepID=A0ACC3CB01_PYRYE|nr:hypothetical protein I4F81_009958 [Neopyropia yezoensis]
MQPPLPPLRACGPTDVGVGGGPSSPALGVVAAGGGGSGAGDEGAGVLSALGGPSRLAPLPAAPSKMAAASPAEKEEGVVVVTHNVACSGGVVDVAAHGGGDEVTGAPTVLAAPPLSRMDELLAGEGGGGGSGSIRAGGGAVELMFADDLEPEDDEGAVEYKWSLVQPPPARFLELVTQMKYRLLEGSGECIYEIGVADDGRARGLSAEALTASLATLSRMAEELHAECTVIRRARATGGEAGDMVASVLVRQLPETLEDYLDLRVAVAGNVDSGKSTLIGVLTGCGALDNGRGRARSQVFTHKHEMETGRTSSVSQQIMGFSASGAVVNYTGVRSLTWADVVARAAKIVTFFDLAGHERYVKTTVFGLTAHAPDYCILVIGANMGVLRMTKEHLAIALALKVPVVVVITKTDRAPAHVYDATVAHIQKLLKSPGARKLPVMVESVDEQVMCAQNIVHDRVVPIFSVSNVTGRGLDLLRGFLSLAPSRRNWAEYRSSPTEFAIDETFLVPGVGTVVSGTCSAGSVGVGQALSLGPDHSGAFVSVIVKSVHYKRVPVRRVVAGQAGSLALKKVKRATVRKGMVMLDTRVAPGAVWEFTAEVLVLYHGTTIRKGYQPVIHCAAVRQAARVMTIDKEVVRTGDRALLRFCFCYRPEHIKADSRFVLREGKTKGIGRILDIVRTC